ncbi:MAG: hypothetical protein RL026_858 [Pseudomonadota bacterium]|jgi:ankyrin repeat protein
MVGQMTTLAAGLLCLAGSVVAAAVPPIEADGTTALHRAAHEGDVDSARSLLRHGAAVDATNAFGATPLKLAAVQGDAAMLDVLLDAGADPDSPNAEGQTALMVVARTGNVEAARRLLKAGADLHARESWGGQTALMWAAAQAQPEMIRFLLSRGARPDERSTVRDWQRRVTAEGRPKDMFRGGLTPLLFAAREACVPCIDALLEGGADINLADPDGVTPLSMALLNLHWDTALHLVRKGADIHGWDWYGQTPLYLAVDMNSLPTGKRVDLPSADRSGGVELVRELLARGANANAQLKLRPRHRHIPYDRYMDPMIVWGTTPLLRAAKAGDLEVMQLLLAHGALPDLANAQGVTPLMAAAGDGHIHDPTRGRYRTEDDALAAVEMLLEAGADADARTILGYADADLKIRTAANRTALHAAASRGWDRVVRRLVAAGATLDVIDSNGLSPIDHALGRFPKEFNAKQAEQYPHTVALLRELGGSAENPTATFPPGTTPRITAVVPP